MRHPFFDVPHPSVIGHRGCAGEAPENTLPSFQRALDQGADILETDVHVTRDGVPVLFHDDDVDRVTDGEGPIAELTRAELARLDAGFRFTLAGCSDPRDRGAGIRVPTLAEAFQAFPEARFNLEIKVGGDAPGRTLAEIERAGRAETTLVTSGEDEIMAILRQELEGAAIRPAQGACLADVLAFLDSAKHRRPPPPGPMALQVPAKFGGSALVTRAFVDHAHQHELAVHVWTVNDGHEMDSLLDLGVDGIVTDHPGRLAALIRQRGP